MQFIKDIFPLSTVSQKNPLYQLEVRRLRWGKIDRQYRRFILKCLFALLITLGGLWWITVFGSSESAFSSDSYENRSIDFVSLLIFISFGANHILELACIAFTVSTLNMQKEQERWDLIRLSGLSPRDIIQAKYVIAQTGVWRLMSSVIALRVVVCILLALHILFVPVLSYESFASGTAPVITTRFMQLLEAFLLSPVMSIFAVLTCGAFTVVYLVDPVWHMRAFTAIGLMISARTTNLTSAFLVAAPLIGSIWFVQAILTIVLPTFITIVFSALGTLALLIAICAATYALYYYYELNLQRWGLQKATYHAFKEDQESFMSTRAHSWSRIVW